MDGPSMSHGVQLIWLMFPKENHQDARSECLEKKIHRFLQKFSRLPGPTAYVDVWRGRMGACRCAVHMPCWGPHPQVVCAFRAP